MRRITANNQLRRGSVQGFHFKGNTALPDAMRRVTLSSSFRSSAALSPKTIEQIKGALRGFKNVDPATVETTSGNLLLKRVRDPNRQAPVNTVLIDFGAMAENFSETASPIKILGREGIEIWTTINPPVADLSSIDRDLLRRGDHLRHREELLRLAPAYVEQSGEYPPDSVRLALRTTSFGIWALSRIALQNLPLLEPVSGFVIGAPIFGLHPQDSLNFKPFYEKHAATQVFDEAKEGITRLASLNKPIVWLVPLDDIVVDVNATREIISSLPPHQRIVLAMAGVNHRLYRKEDNLHLDGFLQFLPGIVVNPDSFSPPASCPYQLVRGEGTW